MLTDEQEYQEIYDLTMAYQAGNNECAAKVLVKFEQYCEGFLILLTGNQLNRMTYSHRIFLSAFVKNGNLARSLRSKSPIPAAFTAAEGALMTVSIQLRPVDPEDLRQEIHEVFLGTLRRYKSINNQNFLLPYIHKSFPYALVRRVKSLIKDPLVNLASDKILSLESLNDLNDKDRTAQAIINQHISSKDIVKHLTISYEKSVDDIEHDQLGTQWLSGEFCSEVFENLTYAERLHIKQFYFLQMTDAQIAEKLGVSYNTAVRRRYHIEDKIKGIYSPPICKWCSNEIPKTSVGRQPRQCSDCKARIKNKKLKDLQPV